MRLAALFSGGKDSTYAIYRAERMGHRVTHLLTVIPSSEEALYFHYPNTWLTALQAEAMGREHLTVECGVGRDEELSALTRLLDTVIGKVDGIVVGALASRFQYEGFGRLCKERGFDVLAPLWGINPLRLLREIIAEGFDVIISGVAAAGLGRELLGAHLTISVMRRLEEASRRLGIHPGGEGGEFETLVLDSPLFEKRVEILESDVLWRGDRGVLYVRRARLVDKG